MSRIHASWSRGDTHLPSAARVSLSASGSDATAVRDCPPRRSARWGSGLPREGQTPDARGAPLLTPGAE